MKRRIPRCLRVGSLFLAEILRCLFGFFDSCHCCLAAFCCSFVEGIIMKKCMFISVMTLMANGACFGYALDMPQDMAAAGGRVICSNAQTLANSLRAHRYDMEGVFNKEEKFDDELLRSLDMKVIQRQKLYFAGATRISGECANHLIDVRGSNYHFCANITLVINNDGLFVPYTKKYGARFFVGYNDPHPGRTQYHFVKAIEVGSGYGREDLMRNFIGIWTRNGRSILTPYKKISSESFYLYDDLLEFDREILNVSFFPHVDTLSGTVQVLLKNGGDRVSLSFWWTYGRLFLDGVD